ncbi:hypothetical protein ABK040_002674 [Willaertia magna]
MNTEQVRQQVFEQVNFLQGRLQQLLNNGAIQIIIDWNSIQQYALDHFPLALEVLSSWNGFLVLGKVVDTIEQMIEEYKGNAQIEISKQLAQVRVVCMPNPVPPEFIGRELTRQEEHKKKLEEAENPTTPYISLNNMILTIGVQLGIGAPGVPNYTYVKERLNAVFGVSCAHYRRMLEERIPKTKQQIKEEAGDQNLDVEIIIDWDSFSKAGNMDTALANMCRWDCWYSLQELPRAFRWVKNEYKLSQDELRNAVKRIVFTNAEDDGIQKNWWLRYSMLYNGTLELRGVWRTYWGYISSWELTRSIGQGCWFDRADLAFERNEALSDETMDELIRAIREVATSDAVRNGSLKPILTLTQRKCFPKLDEKDIEGVDICLKTYWNEVLFEKKEKKEKKEGEEGEVEEEKEEEIEKKEGEEYSEQVLMAYNVNKTNFRGQVQNRLLVVTDKALYTFAYDYKKKALIKKRAHRYTYDKIWYTKYGPMKSENIQVVGGTAGALANAAQELTKDLSNFGLKVETSIITSKKEQMVQKALSQAVKKYVFQILKYLVEEHLVKAIDGEKEPSVAIPGLPKLNDPAILLKLAATSLYKQDVDMKPNIGDIEPANIAHQLEVAAEMCETLSETAEVELSNLPNLKLTQLLTKVCDALIQYGDDMDLNIPSSLSVSSLIRNINTACYKLNQSGKNPTLEFGQPIPVSYEDLMASIKKALDGYKNKNEFDNTGVKMGNGQVFPKLPDLVDRLSNVSGLPDITFDPLPPVLITAILKAISGYLGKYNLPGVNLLELKIPGLDFGSLPGLPRISLPGPPLPGFLGKLKPPSEPSREEFIVQVVNEHKELSKFLSAQLCYMAFAASSSNQYPYWPCSPWETSVIYVPNCVISMVYNKTGGKGNKDKVKE